jgi:putative peptidoglycan lipid II flippase
MRSSSRSGYRTFFETSSRKELSPPQFVKVFTDYQLTKSEEEAWRLASLVMNALAVVLSVIAIIGILFSKQFVNLFGHGFSPEKAALATTLTQIMFPFILLVALAAVAMVC